uniref:Uncharacterized protein n=1 Tax=Palpitomonas bilix TaxID=652834 RepID=A0A7S3GL81_9EUKA|mmetsp:Transcript_8168/g.21675  ORF Transcript_8168/g.21675 Transcript_8168/m.21675 type:complete len:600 (+) Transcript_8168:398-2197(+)
MAVTESLLPIEIFDDYSPRSIHYPKQRKGYVFDDVRVYALFARKLFAKLRELVVDKGASNASKIIIHGGYLSNSSDGTSHFVIQTLEDIADHLRQMAKKVFNGSDEGRDSAAHLLETITDEEGGKEYRYWSDLMSAADHTKRSFIRSLREKGLELRTLMSALDYRTLHKESLSNVMQDFYSILMWLVPLRVNADEGLRSEHKKEIKFLSFLFLCTCKHLHKIRTSEKQSCEPFRYETSCGFEKGFDKLDLFSNLIVRKEYYVFQKLFELSVTNCPDFSTIEGMKREDMKISSFWFHCALQCVVPKRPSSIYAFIKDIQSLHEDEDFRYEKDIWDPFYFFLKDARFYDMLLHVFHVMFLERDSFEPSVLFELITAYFQTCRNLLLSQERHINKPGYKENKMGSLNSLTTQFWILFKDCEDSLNDIELRGKNTGISKSQEDEVTMPNLYRFILYRLFRNPFSIEIYAPCDDDAWKIEIDNMKTQIVTRRYTHLVFNERIAGSLLSRLVLLPLCERTRKLHFKYVAEMRKYYRYLVSTLDSAHLDLEMIQKYNVDQERHMKWRRDQLSLILRIANEDIEADDAEVRDLIHETVEKYREEMGL